MGTRNAYDGGTAASQTATRRSHEDQRMARDEKRKYGFDGLNEDLRKKAGHAKRLYSCRDGSDCRKGKVNFGLLGKSLWGV